MKDMQQGIDDFIEAAGLIRYDPVAIRKIYQGNPGRLIKRLWQTLIPLSLFLLSVTIDRCLGQFNNQEKVRERAKEFANLLVRLGPAFIKAGQALSTRPDIVPPPVLDELSQLQDKLPGFDSDLALACIEEDLKKPIKDIFSSIDKDPISAASLGQVHKGILLNGKEVAVKVQRPGLREQITLDLYIVRNIATWLKQNISLIRSDLVALVDELGTRVFEEMDYVNEASNAERFKELHKQNNKIAVPIIYQHATSRRVLTMEWINGVKLTNIQAVKKLGINPDKMIEIGVNCSLKQLLEHGFFHADPHPGNLLALPDGRLCYLDFGMMSEVSKSSRTGLIQAVVHLVNRSFDKLSKDFVELGFLAEDVDLEPIVPAFEAVFTKALEVGVNKMDFKSVTDDLSGVMYKFPFRVPPYYALIIRSLITLEGIALSVDPNFKILGASYPYFAKRLMEDPEPELRRSLKEMLFEGQILKWDRLEDLMKSAGSENDLNVEDLTKQVLEFMFSSNGEVLRNALIEVTSVYIDNLGWRKLHELNNQLPKRLKSKKFASSRNVQLNANKTNNAIEKKRNLLKRIKNMPGLKSSIVLKHLPKLILEPKAAKMGLQLVARVTEKGMIRLIKMTAGVAQ